jgi:hypothetical protein
VQIVATDEHPFYVVDVGWTTADAIQVGQKLVGAGGAVLTVVANQDWKPDGGVVVYNFQVEGDHTYFVGDIHAQGEWVWTHNMCAARADEAARGLWKLTPEGASKIMEHDTFGTFFKSKSDGLWWAADHAGHGGSAFKVFQESGKGLKWFFDADKFGDQLIGKHKGPVGLVIPWKDLFGGKK